MYRLLDFILSFLFLIIFSPLVILLWFIGLFENGHPLFTQERIGCNEKKIILIKFRTMSKNTKSVATHLIKKPIISKYGYFLRSTKLDEVPQLWNVIKGDMSLVGPRPCLFNQKKLISERKKRGVFRVRPGITGFAQIKGITMQRPTLLAKIDAQMIKQMNLYYYFYYILITLFIFLKKK